MERQRGKDRLCNGLVGHVTNGDIMFNPLRTSQYLQQVPKCVCLVGTYCIVLGKHPPLIFGDPIIWRRSDGLAT